ncbi:MAG: PA2779 family protein [Sulfuricaulis sp.]
MEKYRGLGRSVGRLVIVGMLILSLPLRVAHAGMIGSDEIIDAAQVQHDRARLDIVFNRDDVKAELLARGVDPTLVQARVNDLTDQEVQSLSGKIDQLPAGGDGFFGGLVLVFIVLLITDILGFTDIFTFVNHHKAYHHNRS